MLTKIVARKKDGTMIKGTTGDFLPNKNKFHVTIDEAPGTISEVLIDDLKAVFFVKSLKGNRSPHNRPLTDTVHGKQSVERKLQVTFRDNEIIEGFSHSFHLDRLGFFMNSNDPSDNNERIFVVVSFVKEILFNGKVIDIDSAGTVGDRSCPDCGKKLDLRWKYCPYDGKKII